MVLKFTTDGKFVKQFGKRGPLTDSADLSQFGMVGALELDEKANEIYAADGYGNHRVAVLDADTGAIKRVWGAYGKPPTDDNLPAYNPNSPQFANPVHCIALAKDGSSMSATGPTTAYRSFARTAASCANSCSMPRRRDRARPGVSPSRRSTGSRTISS